MAQDIFLGVIKKNWARGTCKAPLPKTPVQAQLTLTAGEKDKLAKIAVLRMKAESGDRKAQNQWKLLSKRASALGKKARKGDPKAKRLVEVINQSGVLGPAQRISGDIEPRDQDLIETLILRAGNAAGWPTYISKDRYADYQARAGHGDQRSKEVLVILNRYIQAGKVRVSDDKKGQISSYPIGGSICADDLEAAADGGSSERAALARRFGHVRSNVGNRQSDVLA
jgi:hypothetical protein